MAAEPAMVKPPLKIKAADFVPSSLMAGKNHKVLPEATNDGYVNTYRLETNWGEVEAVSDYRLRARIQEINALKTLDDMSRAGVFGDSLVNGALAPIETIGDLVTDPVDTVGGAIDGVGRWFGNVASGATSDDPYQEGALSAAAGWSATKRSFAVELGVDPYTDWEPLQDALVSVGRAAFAGGMTAKVAMSAAAKDTVVEAPLLALNLTDMMRKTLVDNPPERLAEMHRNDLQGLGISEGKIELFLKNYHYSPMEKLQLVEALKRMKGAEGLDFFLADAADAPDKRVARFQQQRAEMMAKFHQEVAPTSLVDLKRAPLQRTEDGRIIGLLPLDFVAWTKDLQAIVARLTKEVGQLPDVKAKELWFEGTVSADTRKAMEAQGWVVKEKAQYLSTS